MEHHAKVLVFDGKPLINSAALCSQQAQTFDEPLSFGLLHKHADPGLGRIWCQPQSSQVLMCTTCLSAGVQVQYVTLADMLCPLMRKQASRALHKQFQFWQA